METTTISSSAKELVQQLREYTGAQQDVWQRIPALALEADGRTGFSDQYSKAYHTGLWCIDPNQRTVNVNLSTGELLATDAQTILFALQPEKLDARKIVTSLEEKAKAPYGSYYNPEEQEQWRARERSSIQTLHPQFYARFFGTGNSQ